MGELLDLAPKLRVKKLYHDLLAEQGKDKKDRPKWLKGYTFTKDGLWRFAKALCSNMSDEELAKMKGGLLKECRKRAKKPRLIDFD